MKKIVWTIIGIAAGIALCIIVPLLLAVRAQHVRFSVCQNEGGVNWSYSCSDKSSDLGVKQVSKDFQNHVSDLSQWFSVLTVALFLFGIMVKVKVRT